MRAYSKSNGCAGAQVLDTRLTRPAVIGYPVVAPRTGEGVTLVSGRHGRERSAIDAEHVRSIGTNRNAALPAGPRAPLGYDLDRHIAATCHDLPFRFALRRGTRTAVPVVCGVRGEVEGEGGYPV